jgi:hypothetical protein
VAMMLVLLDVKADFSVGQRLVEELARLGVTSVAVVRDSATVGVVLEGWLFDPARSACAAANAISATCRARVLHPVLQMAVSTAQSQGGQDVRKASAA